MEKAMIAEFSTRFPALANELGPGNLDTLLGATTVLELPARRKVIRDRMPVDALYMILEGRVEISVEEFGQAITLGHLGPGEWLGEVSVLSGELLASSTVTTETPVKFLRLRHQAFEDLIANNQEIASVLLRQLVLMLADRLRKSGTTMKNPLKIQKVTDAQDGGGVPERAPARNWLESFFSRPGAN
ncbi:MAG: cyclic nucleotide-binding domain-containing protein [Betaproteobacteria bacterium]|nr:cyclic nucleotide-binding domain-containing protein [Betaproteobacteria bacterium]